MPLYALPLHCTATNELGLDVALSKNQVMATTLIHRPSEL